MQPKNNYHIEKEIIFHEYLTWLLLFNYLFKKTQTTSAFGSDVTDRTKFAKQTQKVFFLLRLSIPIIGWPAFYSLGLDENKTFTRNSWWLYLSLTKTKRESLQTIGVSVLRYCCTISTVTKHLEWKAICELYKNAACWENPPLLGLEKKENSKMYLFPKSSGRKQNLRIPEDRPTSIKEKSVLVSVFTGSTGRILFHSAASQHNCLPSHGATQ